MNTKTIFLSKTFWVQLVAVASMLVPQVREFFTANPVEILGVWGAINVLVRFVTSGKVSLGTGDAPTAGGGSLAWLVMIGGTAAAAFLSLPSCSPGQMEALGKVPIQACYYDKDGNKVCYSTTEGVEVAVDRRTSK